MRIGGERAFAGRFTIRFRSRLREWTSKLPFVLASCHSRGARGFVEEGVKGLGGFAGSCGIPQLFGSCRRWNLLDQGGVRECASTKINFMNVKRAES